MKLAWWANGPPFFPNTSTKLKDSHHAILKFCLYCTGRHTQNEKWPNPFRCQLGDQKAIPSADRVIRAETEAGSPSDKLSPAKSFITERNRWESETLTWEIMGHEWENQKHTSVPDWCLEPGRHVGLLLCDFAEVSFYMPLFYYF